MPDAIHDRTALNDHAGLLDVGKTMRVVGLGKDGVGDIASSAVSGLQRIQDWLAGPRALGLPGCSFKDPHFYAIHMFTQVLGGGLTSRLWHEVRESRGLAYGIDAFHWPFSDCGLFGIGAGTALNFPAWAAATRCGCGCSSSRSR